MYKVWSFFIHRNYFSYLLLITLVGFGIFSVVTIPKESAPEVQIPVGIVTTVLPGASALDVEKLVTNKIEERLEGGLDNLNTLNSSSQEGVSVVVAEFNADADIGKSIQKLRDEVDKAKSELPAEADDPIVSEINFVDQPIITLAISGDLLPIEFVRLAQEVEDEILNIPGISKVGISGLRARETQVIVNKEALKTFGLRLVDVIGAIRATNNTLPVGVITVDDIKYNIGFEGDIDDPSEIANIAILSSAGEPVYIRDIAFVSDGLEEATTLSRVSIDGSPSQSSLSFNVFKRTGGDITKLTKEVRSTFEDMQKEGGILNNMDVLVVYDNGELLKKDLTSLSRSGLQTIVLVMIILFLTIGWREALIAGSAIPLSFLVAFIGLLNSGNTLNFVSLFSLILAIGILVDSAIVVVEGIHTRMKTGMEKREAVLLTIKEFHWPLTSGTLTTVAVFAPLFLVSGITGEFIASIPFTIIFVLLASLLVALGLIPLISSVVMRRRMTSVIEERQEIFTTKLQSWYQRQLHRILGNSKRERVFIMGLIAIFIFSLTLPFVGLVKVEFFGQEDFDWVIIEIEKPQGTTLGVSDLETRKVEEVLYSKPYIESFLTTIGQSSPFVGDGSVSSETKLANIFITLRSERDFTSTEIVEEVRATLSSIRTSKIHVSQPSSGPPVGAPIYISFLGDDLEKLDQTASRAAELLSVVPGAVDVSTSARNDSTEFVFTIDKARATELGLDSSIVAQTLRAAVHGTKATTIKNLTDDIDVVVKLNLNSGYRSPHDTARTTIDTVRQIEIETPAGSVLLGSIMDVSLQKSSSVIQHEDRKRVAVLTGQLLEGANAREVIAKFRSRLNEVELPSGVKMEVGGENEEVDQSFKDMFLSLIIGIVLMFTILVLQFNSYRHAVYVLMIVPFSLVGIMIGLAVTGKALSFPSIMGFIALSGIVVNNSIILIDTMNNLRRKNPEKTCEDVVVEAATTRLRPITLTTLTTVIGVIPLTFASDLWAPLAYSIMFGLSFSIVITLLLIPIIYRRWPGTLPEKRNKS